MSSNRSKLTVVDHKNKRILDTDFPLTENEAIQLLEYIKKVDKSELNLSFIKNLIRSFFENPHDKKIFEQMQAPILMMNFKIANGTRTHTAHMRMIEKNAKEELHQKHIQDNIDYINRKQNLKPFIKKKIIAQLEYDIIENYNHCPAFLKEIEKNVLPELVKRSETMGRTPFWANKTFTEILTTQDLMLIASQETLIEISKIEEPCDFLWLFPGDKPAT